MWDTLFAYVLDMSLRGSVVILAVLFARLLLKKAPKVFSYALWAVVLFRLLCPVSIELPVSVVPDMGSVAESYRFDHDPITVIDAGKAVYQVADDAAKGQLDMQQVYIDVPSQLGGRRLMAASLGDICVMAGQYLWMAGVAGFLIYSVVCSVLLRRKLVGVILLGDNVCLGDHINSPFVMGLVRPKIYLPSSLREGERGYIIAHEKCHIRRGDHIFKLFAFAALTLHWFNPLVWLAYRLFCWDMEMSCDEAVIKTLGEDIRADYCASLLNLATGKRYAGITPLAFGEGDTKGRIYNLAKWKKPVIWVVVAAILVCITAAVCLLTDPTPKANNITETTTQTDEPQPGGTSMDTVFDITLSYAGYTGEASLYAEALNASAMAISSVQHLPIYKFDTRMELDSFMGTFGKFLSMNQGYEEVPSFYGVSERYDEAFFAEKTLVLVYITASSGSYRYGVDSIYCGGNSFVVHVKKTKAPQAHTADMAGWFLTAAVPDTMVSGVQNFDADLGNTEAAGGYIPSAWVENTDGNTVCRVLAYLPSTDFSGVSETVKNKVASDWRVHDALTPFQQLSSSHLFGWISLRHDTWQACEEDLGVTIPNPIGSIPWLEKTDVYGGIATDPSILHAQLTVHATDSTKRTVEKATLNAGYRTEGVRVVITATVHAKGTVYVTGLGADGTVEFTQRETVTGSGIPVLLLESEDDGSYSDLDAGWVDGNVYYNLHLVGEKGADNLLHSTMEKILKGI